MNKPNFILIFPDQWRGDCLGVIGHPVIKTPFLDHIASEGIVFLNAYSAAPTCIPTRACLATGQSPSTNGRLGYKDGVPWKYKETLMKCLRNSDYQTMQSGKTHFYPQRAALGFEESRLYEIPIYDSDFESDYHVWLTKETGGKIQDIARQADPNTWVVKPWKYDEELHCTNWIINSAIELLWRRDTTRPFFLQIGIHRPHAPYDPPEDYYEMYKNCELPPIPVGNWAAEYDRPTSSVNCWHGRLPQAILDNTRRAYYANITHIDYQIGKLYNWLRKANLLDNTYIVFLSDHGEQLGDHCQMRKATPFEGSAKVPMIIRPPKNSNYDKKVVCEKVVTHIDVMPTILELAGIQIPDMVEGKSMTGLMKGETNCWREFMHGEHANGNHGWQYLTDGKEKYIWETASGRELFFDLINDPHETLDRSKDIKCMDKVKLWRKRLIEILSKRHNDGLSDGEQLIPGKVLPYVRNELLE